jgi:tetratricopeptide (TPR) repeat protein
MINHNDISERPVGKYQDFLDGAVGSDFSRAMEEGHAYRVLEAIEYAKNGSYDESFSSFVMASRSAPTLAGKQCCENFSQAVSNAQKAFDTALSNAASEIKAEQIAEAVWHKSSKGVSIYLSFLGVYFSERGKHDAAIQYHNRALEINPGYAMAYFSRGNAKVDLHLYDEAIPDLEQAAQLFKMQDDLISHHRAIAILNSLENCKFESYKEFEHGNLHQTELSVNKETGDTTEMICNAAQYQAFLVELAKKFPKTPKNKCQELAAGMLYKHINQKYDDQEYQYTAVDREFFKAVCFQQGLDVQRITSKNRSRNGFLVGFAIGGLIMYAFLKLHVIG